jgi:predicted glycoside hydrolase/deacetylase ChbG (UPF0249 family)
MRVRSVTSATAMMFMADSRRAASLSRATRQEVGLHINLSQPYTADDVPDSVAERQTTVTRHFHGSTRRRIRQWVYDPLLRANVEAVIADQLDEFQAQFGTSPTHIDGHQHVQVCPNVAFARTIPVGTKTRSGMLRYPLHRTPLGVARALRHRAIASRLEPLPSFFPIRLVHPHYGGSGLGQALSLARRSPVEIMVHPGSDDEFELLMSDAWRQDIADLRLGSYADFVGRRATAESATPAPPRA